MVQRMGHFFEFLPQYGASLARQKCWTLLGWFGRCHCHHTLRRRFCAALDRGSLRFAFFQASALSDVWASTSRFAACWGSDWSDGAHATTATAQLFNQVQTIRTSRGTWKSHASSTNRPDPRKIGHVPTNTCPFNKGKHASWVSKTAVTPFPTTHSLFCTLAYVDSRFSYSEK